MSDFGPILDAVAFYPTISNDKRSLHFHGIQLLQHWHEHRVGVPPTGNRTFAEKYFSSSHDLHHCKRTVDPERARGREATAERVEGTAVGWEKNECAHRIKLCELPPDFGFPCLAHLSSQ